MHTYVHSFLHLFDSWVMEQSDFANIVHPGLRRRKLQERERLADAATNRIETEKVFDSRVHEAQR